MIIFYSNIKYVKLITATKTFITHTYLLQMSSSLTNKLLVIYMFLL